MLTAAKEHVENAELFSDVSDVDEENLDMADLIKRVKLCKSGAGRAFKSDVVKSSEENDDGDSANEDSEDEQSVEPLASGDDEEREFNDWVENSAEARRTKLASKDALLSLQKDSERLLRAGVDMPMRWSKDFTMDNFLKNRKRPLEKSCAPPTPSPRKPAVEKTPKLKADFIADKPTSIERIKQERLRIIENIKRKSQKKSVQDHLCLNNLVSFDGDDDDDDDEVEIEVVDIKTPILKKQHSKHLERPPVWKLLQGEKKGQATFLPLKKRNVELQNLIAAQSLEKRKQESKYVDALIKTGRAGQRKKGVAKALQKSMDTGQLEPLISTEKAGHSTEEPSDDDTETVLDDFRVPDLSNKSVDLDLQQPKTPVNHAVAQLQSSSPLSKSPSFNGELKQITKFNLNSEADADFEEFFVATAPSSCFDELSAEDTFAKLREKETHEVAERVTGSQEASDRKLPSSEAPIQPLSDSKKKGTIESFFTRRTVSKQSETAILSGHKLSKASADGMVDAQLPAENSESASYNLSKPQINPVSVESEKLISLKKLKRILRADGPAVKSRFVEDEAEEDEDELFAIKPVNSNEDDDEEEIDLDDIDPEQLLELQRMIVDDRAIDGVEDSGENAKLFRQRMADHDQAMVEQLLEDITLGKLRKKRRYGGAVGTDKKGLDLDSESDSEDEEGTMREARQAAAQELLMWQARYGVQSSKKAKTSAEEQGASALSRYERDPKTKAFAKAFALDNDLYEDGSDVTEDEPLEELPDTRDSEPLRKKRDQNFSASAAQLGNEITDDERSVDGGSDGYDLNDEFVVNSDDSSNSDNETSPFNEGENLDEIESSEAVSSYSKLSKRELLTKLKANDVGHLFDASDDEMKNEKSQQAVDVMEPDSVRDEKEFSIESLIKSKMKHRLSAASETPVGYTEFDVDGENVPFGVNLVSKPVGTRRNFVQKLKEERNKPLGPSKEPKKTLIQMQSWEPTN